MSAPIAPDINIDAGRVEALGKGLDLPSIVANRSIDLPDKVRGDKQGEKSTVAQQIAKPAANTEGALDFLDPWDARHDLAAIDPEGIECATFLFPNEREKARRWIEARQGKKNLHIQVNQARKDAPRDKRLNEKHIGLIRAIPVDMDIKVEDPSDFPRLKTKLLKEVAPKIAKLECPPNVIVDSGGGLQAWWIFDKCLEATPENAERVKGIGRTLSERLQTDFPEYEVDNVSDLPRLMRLPGTINIPDETKRKRGRSPAPATELAEYYLGEYYSLEKLAKCAPPTIDRRSKSSEMAWPEIDMALVRSANDYDDLPANCARNSRARASASLLFAISGTATRRDGKAIYPVRDIYLRWPRV